MSPLSSAEFAALMEGLGFDDTRGLGAGAEIVVGVSGGADSLALTFLADIWARARGGRVIGLIVDHGLRPEAAAEAAETAALLSRLGIAQRILRLRGLGPGPGIQARARGARLALLQAAASELGVPFLLLGHHAADQAETLLLRALDGSGPAGMAGMAARRETRDIALLRPLLTTKPGRLRATLTAADIPWHTDPSNADPRFLRARLRRSLAGRDGDGSATAALVRAAALAGRRRAGEERARAALLAARVALHPEGYALLTPGPIAPAALAALIRVLGGAEFAPSERRVASLAACPAPATLAGVRLVPAGRLGPGWLIMREAQAMAPPVPAIPGIRWDGRFRLALASCPPAGASLGALGAAGAARLRRRSSLPAAVLASLPALRVGEELAAVPHLGYPDERTCARVPVLFSPNEPAAGAPFMILDPGGDAEMSR
ncbi:MAG TPA: tRNA lysidine(34) synthetase TilS [Acetobacteraceae bacterium]|nr:tRNA lysidine(34) synthetase TilS [Acetobacteraceae bacterium]